MERALTLLSRGQWFYPSGGNLEKLLIRMKVHGFSQKQKLAMVSMRLNPRAMCHSVVSSSELLG